MKTFKQPTIGGLYFLALILMLHIHAPSSGAANTDNREQQFEQANRLYTEGKYSAAVQLYEKIASTHGLSAELLYNMGNSYAQDGWPGRAVLSYLRAIHLSPGDPDIIGNLQLIRKEQGLFQPERSFAQRALHLLEMNQWCLAAGFIFFALTLFHLGCFFFPQLRKRCLWLSILLLTAVVICSLSAFYRYQDFHDGVVIVQDAHLRISPFTAASSVGILQEGRVIRPIKTHGEFTLVEDSSGRSGWLHQDQFGLVVEN